MPRKYHPTGRPAGRPSDSDVRQRQVEAILDGVSAGRSLEEVCKDAGMPTPTEFRGWARRDALLGKAWKGARFDQAHSLFDRMTDLAKLLADGPAGKGWGKDDSSQVNALKASVDTLKHITSRLKPEDYAEQKPGTQGVSVTIVTSLPLGMGSVPERPMDTAFRVVGKSLALEEKSD